MTAIRTTSAEKRQRDSVGEVKWWYSCFILKLIELVIVSKYTWNPSCQRMGLGTKSRLIIHGRRTDSGALQQAGTGSGAVKPAKRVCQEASNYPQGAAST